MSPKKRDDESTIGSLGNSLQTKKAAKVGEIVIIFVVALAVIALATSVADGNPLLLQAIVWTAYILMLGLVWLGLRLRGETWDHFGLSFKSGERRTIVRATLKSLLVFVAAIAAFVVTRISHGGNVLSGNPAKESRLELREHSCSMVLEF